MDSLKTIELNIENCHSRIINLQKNIKSAKYKIFQKKIVLSIQFVGFLITGSMVLLSLIMAYDIYRNIVDQSSIINQYLRKLFNGWFWVYLLMVTCFSWGLSLSTDRVENIKKLFKDLKNFNNSIDLDESSIRKQEIEIEALKRQKNSYSKVGGLSGSLD